MTLSCSHSTTSIVDCKPRSPAYATPHRQSHPTPEQPYRRWDRQQWSVPPQPTWYPTRRPGTPLRPLYGTDISERRGRTTAVLKTVVPLTQVMTPLPDRATDAKSASQDEPLTANGTILPPFADGDAGGRNVGVRKQLPTSTGLIGPLFCVVVEAAQPPPITGARTILVENSTGDPPRRREMTAEYLKRTFFASVTSNICDSVQWNGIHISYARLTTRRTVIMFRTPRVRDTSMTVIGNAGCRHARTALPVAVAIR